MIHVGVFEHAHPIELASLHEVAQLLEIAFGFAGEADDERRAQGYARNGDANAFEQLQKSVAVRAALHSRQDVAAGVLQRHVHILRQAGMSRQSIQQFLCDAIRIRVKESHPKQILDAGERGE